MAVVTLTPPSITNTFPSPHADPIHKIHKIEEQPLHLRNPSMFDIQDDPRNPPGVARHWSPPIDNLDWMSQHIQHSRWSPQFIGYQMSLTPIYHQAQFNALAHLISLMFAVGFSISCIFGPHFPASPFDNMDLPLLAYLFLPLNDRIDQSKCFL